MDIRVHTVGLIISCPMNNSMDDCPYERYRNKPISYLNAVVKEIPHDEIIALTKHHKKCLNSRINSINGTKKSKVENKKSKLIDALPCYHFLSF